GLGPLVVNLGDDEQHGPGGTPQRASHHEFGVCRAGMARDNEQDQVGGGDRPLRLLGHSGSQAASVRLPSPGVNESEATSGPYRVIRDPVPRYARHLLNPRLATPEHAVDERRLTHVGPTDDRDNGRDRYVVRTAHPVRRVLVSTYAVSDLMTTGVHQLNHPVDDPVDTDAGCVELDRA